MLLDLIQSLLLSAGVAAGITLLALLVLIPWAHRIRLLDHPNYRSSHEIPTPRIGGLGVSLGLAVSFFLFAQWDILSLKIASFFMALLVVSLLDDKFDLPASIRFGTHFLISGLLVYIFDLHPSQLILPLLTIDLPPWLAISGTILFMVAFLNFFNFMDGINGIAAFQASLGTTGLIFLFYLGGVRTNNLYVVMAATVGGCLGFLPLNFPKAKTFMGDAGSTVLGLAMASWVCFGSTVSPKPSFLVFLLPIWPFFYDATFTLFKRALRKEMIWKPHREHHYQLMIRAGMGHATVSLLYSAMIVFCSSLAIIYTLTHRVEIQIGLLVILVLGSITYSICVHRYYRKKIHEGDPPVSNLK